MACGARVKPREVMIAAMREAQRIAALSPKVTAEVYDLAHFEQVKKRYNVMSVPCLVVTGLCRIRGKRPFFGFHAILCVFCIIHLLNQYRVWSGNPQLPDYLFQVFACISLTLTAYYRTAFDLGMGRRRLYLFSNLMAVYLCFLSLVGSGDGRFYFGGGVWALANLCVLDPPPRQVKPDTIRIPTDPERM